MNQTAGHGDPGKVDMAYEYWLARIRDLSQDKKKQLRGYMKTAKEVYYYIEETDPDSLPFLTEKDINVLREAAGETDIQEEYEKMTKKEIRFIPWFSEEYPARLLELGGYPYALYVKGSLPSPVDVYSAPAALWPGQGKKAAIVGARKCTPYGEKYAVEFGQRLAEAGVEIISGLARGIDGMGQRGALMGKGRTFAVLGSGADVCYPQEHIGLYMDILAGGGGILSEYPPGTPPFPRNFPARNRIISGLADAILVIEARERSGSLITADMALEQGRDVYALPGPVNSDLSMGCNRLIRQGAGLLLSPEALLEEWGCPPLGNGTGNGSKKEQNKKMLESVENLVYACLGLYPKNTDQLARETGLEVKELMGVLVSLELKGYAREISKNYFISLI